MVDWHDFRLLFCGKVELKKNSFEFLLRSLGLIPRRLRRFVIPAKAGIYKQQLDAGSGPA
jgi:hypothetical protein